MESYFGQKYLRVQDDLKHIPRGTILLEDQIISGYPHVGRILTLNPGLSQHFQAPFIAEEKIDGYNVRIFQSESGIKALSRGGFFCPFSTDRAGDFIPDALFKKYPDLIVCAEIAGPENPYNLEAPPFIKSDIHLYIFDFMRKGKFEFLSQDEKKEIIEEFDLSSVNTFGIFNADQPQKIIELTERLDKENREGLVLKEISKRNHRAKFVTPNSSLEDIRTTSLFMHDVENEYFVNRISQIGLYMKEAGRIPDDELYRQLGKALLDGELNAYEMYLKEGRVKHTFRCRFHGKNSAYALIEQLNARHPHGGIQKRSLEKEDDMWVLEFDRVFAKTTGLFGYFIGGGLLFD